MYCLHNLGQFNIFRLQGFCLFRIIYKPRERILSAHGVCRLKYLIGYRFFRHGNLPVNEHAMQFFYAKTYRFCADFPLVPVGAAICRPPKCEAFSLINPHIVRTIITYYLLLLTYYFKYLPPAKMRSIFPLYTALCAVTIAAKPRS